MKTTKGSQSRSQRKFERHFKNLDERRSFDQSLTNILKAGNSRGTLERPKFYGVNAIHPKHRREYLASEEK